MKYPYEIKATKEELFETMLKMDKEIKRLNKENENLTNKLIEIYKYEYGIMSDEELLEIIKEIKESDKE